MNRLVYTLAALAAFAAPTQASNSPIATLTPEMQMRGAVNFNLFGFRIYSARLYTPEGQQFSWANPVALELNYNRTISQERLTSVTLSELKRLEEGRSDYASLEPKLNTCFRDVKDGDQFLALGKDKNTIEFWFNGARTCRLSHTEIRKRFLGIWLSEDSRAPRLSQRLRGE